MTQGPATMDSADTNSDHPSAASEAVSSALAEEIHQASEGATSDAPALEGQELPGMAPPVDDPVVPPTPSADARQQEIAMAVDMLAQIALQLDDPVSALDEGAEALAEALAERDEAIQRQHLAAATAQAQQDMRRAEFTEAYQHARLHRVGELIDLGHHLDEAVAITNANEIDIRHRALAAGRDPAEVIYRYALSNGYRPRSAHGQDKRPARAEVGAAIKERIAGGSDRHLPELEVLAAMSDDEFSRATSGDRWQRLLQGN